MKAREIIKSVTGVRNPLQMHHTESKDIMSFISKDIVNVPYEFKCMRTIVIGLVFLQFRGGQFAPDRNPEGVSAFPPLRTPRSLKLAYLSYCPALTVG